MKRISGFTLVEVLLSMCIFAIVSMSFLKCLEFSIHAGNLSQTRYELALRGEEALEEVIIELKGYPLEEITPNLLSTISDKYSDEDGDFYVLIEQASRNDLYRGEIIFKESRYESLCTLIRME